MNEPATEDYQHGAVCPTVHGVRLSVCMYVSGWEGGREGASLKVVFGQQMVTLDWSYLGLGVTVPSSYLSTSGRCTYFSYYLRYPYAYSHTA